MAFELPNKFLNIPTVFFIIFVLAFIVFQIWRRRRPVIKIEKKCVLWTYIGLLILTVVLSVIGFVVILLITGRKDLNEDLKDLNRRIAELNRRIDSSKGNVTALSTAVFDIQTLISNQPATALANVKGESGLDTLENKKILDIDPLRTKGLRTWGESFFYQLRQCHTEFKLKDDLTNGVERVEAVQAIQSTVSEGLNVQKHWQNLATQESSALGSTHQHVKNYLNTVPILLDQFSLLFVSSPSSIIDANKKEISDLNSSCRKFRIAVLILSAFAFLFSLLLLGITVFYNFKSTPSRWLHISLVVILVIVTVITLGISMFLLLSTLGIWNVSYTCSTPTAPQSFNSTFTPFK